MAVSRRFGRRSADSASSAGEIFFAVRGDRLLVYAAGADGDDDGGRAAGNDFAAMPPFDPDDPGPPVDGDVVLFGVG